MNRRIAAASIRSAGPLTLIAASTRPSGAQTGALTLATPASRSPMLWAKPCSRTPARTAGGTSKASRSGAHASSTLPPEPLVSGITAPSGTVSRRPLGRSCTATQIRCVAFAHVQLCALSRRRREAGEHGPGRIDQAAAAGRLRAPPHQATAELEAAVVGRERASRAARTRSRAGTRSAGRRPVSRTRSASEQPSSAATVSSTRTTRSSVCTPVRPAVRSPAFVATLSTYRYYCLMM